MKTQEIKKTIENNDAYILKIDQQQLAKIGWDFEEDENFDRFVIDMYNNQLRLFGETQTGYNPGYGTTNYGQGPEYGHNVCVAVGDKQFGDEEGLRDFWELVEEAEK